MRIAELERLLALQKVSGLADMSPEDKAYIKTKGREERGHSDNWASHRHDDKS